MNDFATARRHMVDGQLRIADVTDLRILAAMDEIARETFLPAGMAELAYLDFAIPVGDPKASRRLLKPMALAKMLQALDLAGTDRVLDIGCCTGYTAAVLARVAGSVVALEEDSTLAATARRALAGAPNVQVVEGPLPQGWAAAAPYDAIVIEGAVEEVPQALLAQLKDGGRMVCVRGQGPGAKAVVSRRSGDDYGDRTVFDASATLLSGFAKPLEFAF